MDSSHDKRAVTTAIIKWNIEAARALVYDTGEERKSKFICPYIPLRIKCEGDMNTS